MATWVIGDIHGCVGPLDTLLRLIGPQLAPADTVVFLGDIIDRGPDARGCVERILSLAASTPARVVALRGNHENWMLRSLRDSTRHSWLLGMEAMPTIASWSGAAAAALGAALEECGVRIVTERISLPYDLFFRAMPPEHLRFFESMVMFYRTPDVVCTHGGCDPAAGPIDTQPAESLMWGSDDFPDGYDGPDLIVYGHRDDALVDAPGPPRPRIGRRSIGIDTISHGVLTCLRLPDRRMYQATTESACVAGLAEES
jgi:calcineurin-like phosphoesterase family protein